MTESAKYAHAAHDSIGQKRKYSGEPYWVHTDEVRALVEAATSNKVLTQAADLHDVLEDVFPVNSVFRFESIAENFGFPVAFCVFELTDKFTKDAYPMLNRKDRKCFEAMRLSGVSPGAKLVKLCDLISNSNSILKDDPKFAKTYIPEKRDVLREIKNGVLSLRGWADFDSAVIQEYVGRCEEAVNAATLYDT